MQGTIDLESRRILSGDEKTVLRAVWVLDGDPGLLQWVRISDGMLEPRVARDSKTIVLRVRRSGNGRQAAAHCALTVDETLDLLDIGLERTTLRMKPVAMSPAEHLHASTAKEHELCP